MTDGGEQDDVKSDQHKFHSGGLLRAVLIVSCINITCRNEKSNVISPLNGFFSKFFRFCGLIKLMHGKESGGFSSCEQVAVQPGGFVVQLGEEGRGGIRDRISIQYAEAQ